MAAFSVIVDDPDMAQQHVVYVDDAPSPADAGVIAYRTAVLTDAKGLGVGDHPHERPALVISGACDSFASQWTTVLEVA